MYILRHFNCFFGKTFAIAEISIWERAQKNQTFQTFVQHSVELLKTSVNMIIDEHD